MGLIVSVVSRRGRMAIANYSGSLLRRAAESSCFQLLAAVIFPQPLLRLPEHGPLESLATQTPPPPQAFQRLGVRFLLAPFLHPLVKLPPCRLGIPPDTVLPQQSRKRLRFPDTFTNLANPFCP